MKIQSSPGVVLEEKAPEAVVTNWLPDSVFPFESRYAGVEGHRLHYVDTGTGPTLLMVHAGPAWSMMFGGLITRLASDFRCVVLDPPGSGPSVPAESYDYGLESTSRAVAAFIERLGLGDYTLLVHDLGGPVALTAAAENPSAVHALILSDTFAWPLRDFPKIARLLKIVSGGAFGFVDDRINLLARGTARFGLKLPSQARRSYVHPFTRERRRGVRRMFRDAATNDEFMERAEDAVNALSDRATLVLFGEKDPTVKEGFVERWRQQLPDSRFEFIEGGAHFPQATHAEDVATVIKEWWTGQFAGV
jgi:haloalkane dehalogenase